MATAELQGLSAFIDVDDLMNRCLGNVEFAQHILEVLGDRCESDLDELGRALEAGDTALVAEVAHRLKGALASGAADGLSKLAGQICQAAANPRDPELSRLVGELRNEWEEFAALITGTDQQT